MFVKPVILRLYVLTPDHLNVSFYTVFVAFTSSFVFSQIINNHFKISLFKLQNILYVHLLYIAEIASIFFFPLKNNVSYFVISNLLLILHIRKIICKRIAFNERVFFEYYVTLKHFLGKREGVNLCRSYREILAKQGE